MSDRIPSRVLEVLLIDDSDQSVVEEKDAYRELVRIHPLKRWIDVQRMMTSVTAPLLPDIIICDVSFASDPSLAKWNRGSQGTPNHIVPIGLTLALPFIFAREITALVPYSQHAKKEGGLDGDPTYLLTMGLIAARTTGKVYESRTLHATPKAIVGKTLEDYLQDSTVRVVPLRAPSALRAGLEQYRTRFRNVYRTSKHMLVTNLRELMELMQEAKREIKRNKKFDLPEDAAIEFVGHRGRDRILLSSLYGDVLNWGNEINEEAHKQIDNDLSQMSPADPAFACAVEVIDAIDDLDTPLPVDRMIKKLFPKLKNRVDQHEVMRLCVLLANVLARHYENVEIEGSKVISFGPTSVLRHLGMPANQDRTYHGWFGLRKDSRPAPKTRRQPSGPPQTSFGVLGKNGLLPTFSTTGSNWDSLLTDDSVLGRADDDRVHTYLKRIGSDVEMPYTFDPTRP